tara:strand:+ start:865 stop:2391 length:1527 start_codon:yes stop_codon:yes gene_type:complete
MYEGWPRAVYVGTLSEGEVKTTQEITEFNNYEFSRERIQYVYREPSTGNHNCQDAGCSNYYIYKRKFQDNPGVGAHLELETHWGCRPLLCTGDYSSFGINTGDLPYESFEYLYDLDASYVPCGFGCNQEFNYEPNLQEPFTLVRPHEVACTMGSFGGVQPSCFTDGPFDWGSGSHQGHINDPIKYADSGDNIWFGRIFISLYQGKSNESLFNNGVCSSNTISNFMSVELPQWWGSSVPDYSDPLYLDPDFQGGLGEQNNFHHGLGYHSPNNCGCRTSDCIKENNPVSEGNYELDPVPFRPTGGVRMFVDLVPQAGVVIDPISIYLDYLHDRHKAESFSSSMSGRVVFDSAGNQYLVSDPYAVDLSTNGKPHYPERSKGIPTLAEEQMSEVAVEEMSQISVEFGLVCQRDMQSPLCTARLNAILHPSEGITSTGKQIELNDDYSYTTSAVLRDGQIEIHVQIPYGASSRVISKTIKPTCLKDQGCMFETISEESLNGMFVNITAVVYQQ